MNRFIITITLMVLLVSTGMLGQDFQGKATYFSKYIYKSEKKLTDEVDKIREDKELDEALKIAMKKSSEKTFTLLFNKHEAVYEENEELEKPSAPSGGFSVSISMTGGGKKYMNTKEKIDFDLGSMSGEIKNAIGSDASSPNKVIIKTTSGDIEIL